MELRSLKLSNFLSHKDTCIEFAPNRKVLLDGVSGSGKTAVVEAIIWSLFGRGRSDNRGLIKKGAKKATVDLTLADGDKYYVIRRSVTEKGTQSLEVSCAQDSEAIAVPATSLKEKQRYIERELLKSSYELFINAVVWPQDSSQSFVKQPAAARKNLLLEIVGTGAFDEMYDKAKENLTRITLNRGTSEMAIQLGAEAVKADSESVAAFDANPVDTVLLDFSISAARDAHEEAASLMREIEAEIPVLTKKVADRNLSETLRKAYLEEKSRLTMGVHPDALGEDMDRLTLELDKIRTDKVMYAVISAAKEQNLKTSKKRAALETDIVYSKTTIEVNQAMVKSMAEELAAGTPADSLCPNTGNVCVRARDILEKRRAEILENMASTSGLLGTYTKRVSDKEAELASLTLVPVDEDRLKALEAGVSRESAVSVELSKLQTLEDRILAVEENLAKYPEIPDLGEAKRLAEAKTELEAHRKAWTENRMKENDLRNTIAMYAIRKAEVDTKRLRVADYQVQAAKLAADLAKLAVDEENVTLVKDALGSNGIKVVIVDTVLPKLEMRINEVLSELTDFRVKLDTQRTSASDAEKQVEGLFITVLNGEGEELDFDSYSGGERLKISVAITEALAELQNSSFRILDEMIVGLDAESVSQFSEILLKLQARFSQIIAISHLPEVKQLFDDRITVTKKAGTSSI